MSLNGKKLSVVNELDPDHRASALQRSPRLHCATKGTFRSSRQGECRHDTSWRGCYRALVLAVASRLHSEVWVKHSQSTSRCTSPSQGRFLSRIGSLPCVIG